MVLARGKAGMRFGNYAGVYRNRAGIFMPTRLCVGGVGFSGYGDVVSGLRRGGLAGLR